MLLPKQGLVAFSAMRNSLFPVLFKSKALRALKETLASSPSDRVSFCTLNLQQNLPFLQPQQVGWAVTFQGCKGLTKSVLRELHKFCFGHCSKPQHNI